MENLKIELRNLVLDDYVQLNETARRVYEENESLRWDEGQIKKLLDIFPQGQLCLEVNGRVVASALTIIVDYKKFDDNHTFRQITADETFDTHDPKGDVLYGIEVFVHPDYRGMRLGRRLYDARKELCENLNLRSIIFGGRIPNFKDYDKEMKPREYIQKVKENEIYDPVLTFQLSNDFHVRKVLKGYLPGDAESRDYAVLLEWNNVYYEDQIPPMVGAQKKVVRLGLVQWQMRRFDSVDELMEQTEYFVDAVSDYQADFVLFPELFNAPLMAKYNHLGEAQAIRGLAGYTERIYNRFRDLAVSYNVNIVGGSMPVIEHDKLYNVTYLCRRDGTTEQYYKLHITPAEKAAWGMTGGDQIKVFDTDCGKIGILVCYDVEFPELSRVYADQGMEILFVPFLTDTQNGYNRVRVCAQARAVENECYVAIAGCVGNLPNVNNMDIQFAQSAVFTPSDFAFPTNSIKAEATPNTEMTLIADVDLDLLKELHHQGSVRTLSDRRRDIYEIVLKNLG
ncbi:MAG: GNAT family N-acetyltransferase [Candidatus Kapaibacterium sp.]